MEGSSNKRKATHEGSTSVAKKQKNWQTPKQAKWTKAGKEIHAGDAGIWVTCERGREGKAAAEFLDLLGEYAQKLYPDFTVADTEDKAGDSEDEPSDIEKAISSEISDIKKSSSTKLFKVIRPDVECVLFIKTRHPVNPVSLVHTVCKETASGTALKHCRFVKRLTPATTSEKAQERNFEDLARKVFKPVFHEDNSGSKKFAVRFSSRNHTVMSRSEVIKVTADLVGSAHKVDLDHPEVLVLIEMYKNICTMAVVDGDYNDLKKYNLNEIVSHREQTASHGPSRLAKLDAPTQTKDAAPETATEGDHAAKTKKEGEIGNDSPALDP